MAVLFKVSVSVVFRYNGDNYGIRWWARAKWRLAQADIGHNFIFHNVKWSFKKKRKQKGPIICLSFLRILEPFEICKWCLDLVKILDEPVSEFVFLRQNVWHSICGVVFLLPSTVMGTIPPLFVKLDSSVLKHSMKSKMTLLILSSNGEQPLWIWKFKMWLQPAVVHRKPFLWSFVVTSHYNIFFSLKNRLSSRSEAMLVTNIVN